MDTRTRCIAALLLLFASASVGAQDASQQRAAFGVPYLIPPSAVPLEQGQREELADLRRELHDEHCRLGARIIDLQEKLRAVAGREQRDTRAAAQLTQKIDALRRRAATARSQAMKRAEALLTEEQRVTLAKWRRGRRGEAGEIEDIPYTVLPSIEADEPDIEDLEDPEPDPRY